MVEPGQPLKAGQLIGRAEQPGAVNVHTPLAGRVKAITRVATAMHTDAPAILIETADESNNKKTDNNANDRPTTEQPSEGMTLTELAELADEAGIANVCDPAIGLGEQLRRANSIGIRDVIINGMSREPMLTADREILRLSLDTIVAAGVRVRDALGARHLWLTIDRSDRELVSLCRGATQRTPVRVAALRYKYPQAKPVLLALVTTGREPGYGKGPEDVNALVLELEPLIALEAAIRSGQPMLDRVVTVVGPAILRSGHYRIPIGTSFADVLRHVGLSRPASRVIDGGIMTGRAVETLETVVTKQTNAILAIDRDHEHIPIPGPCLRCGWCQDTCPAGLDPLAILDTFERHDVPRANRLYPQACLECGLCSYVCPSELPLTEAAVKTKRTVSISTG